MLEVQHRPAAIRAHSILLVEDDAELCSLMTDFFLHHGFRIEAISDGRRGLMRSLEGNFDIIILDVMLPSLNGFDLLRQLRKRSSTPVIMLTARTGKQDRIMGLDTGADDYLPKPFEPDELLARIRAILRRAGKETVVRDTIEAGGLTLDSRVREVRYRNQPLEITSVEFDILDRLMASAGQVVSRDALAVVLYQRESTPYERSLDVHISHLRKKLEVTGRSLIRTVRGIGYLFSP